MINEYYDHINFYRHFAINRKWITINQNSWASQRVSYLTNKALD